MYYLYSITNPITKEFRQELYDNILELHESMEETGKAAGSMEVEGADEPEFEVRVSPYEREGSNMLGLARIYFEDCFVVGNISILQGKEKEFVAMPSYRTGKSDKDGKSVYQDVCYPVTKEFREKLYDSIFDCYRQEKENHLENIREQAQNRQGRTEPEKNKTYR